MAETGRVLIWVQHLLGTGPLRGVGHVARYMAAQGWEVDLVSGGPPVRGIDFGGARLHQLPPVRAADPSFTRLVYLDGKPLDDAIKTLRRDLLLRIFEGADPNVLILEQFPFNRPEFRFELGPLLMAAVKRPTRPAIVSSVREIVVERPAEREAAIATAIEEVFDTVLVHGDPRLIGLEESFGAVGRIANKIVYTGYVGGTAPPVKTKPGVGSNEIIVSAGGGTFGTKLATVAIDAAKTMQYGRRWRILLDTSAGPRALRKLRARAPEWVDVEPARPDYRVLLSRCALSISQAGYNTVVDVLAAGARAVFVPYSHGGGTEQQLRAQLFEQRGLAHMLSVDSLSPGRLAHLVSEAVDLPKSIRKVKIDGETTAERVLSKLVATRSGEAHP